MQGVRSIFKHIFFSFNCQNNNKVYKVLAIIMLKLLKFHTVNIVGFT